MGNENNQQRATWWRGTCAEHVQIVCRSWGIVQWGGSYVCADRLTRELWMPADRCDGGMTEASAAALHQKWSERPVKRATPSVWLNMCIMEPSRALQTYCELSKCWWHALLFMTSQPKIKQRLIFKKICIFFSPSGCRPVLGSWSCDLFSVFSVFNISQQALCHMHFFRK